MCLADASRCSEMRVHYHRLLPVESACWVATHADSDYQLALTEPLVPADADSSHHNWWCFLAGTESNSCQPAACMCGQAGDAKPTEVAMSTLQAEFEAV